MSTDALRSALAELVRLQDDPGEHENWRHIYAAWAAARAALAQPAAPAYSDITSYGVLDPRNKVAPAYVPLTDAQLDEIESLALARMRGEGK